MSGDLSRLARDRHLSAPDFLEILEAAERLSGVLVKTPLLESERVNDRFGCRVLLKAEGLQRTGSFKARGALNFIAQMDEEERRRGVVAYSSGNHGQAVAWAAARHGIPAVVIMPDTAPATKVERAGGWGAEIRQIDWRPDIIAGAVAALTDRGFTLVPPFEHRHIIAGAGTCAMEVLQQATAVGAVPDVLLVGCSGGGLLAGSALSAAALSPATETWAVEPEGFDDLARSLAHGSRLANETPAHSICDALVARTTGDLTFAIACRHVRGAVVVSDEAVMAAMRLAFEEFRVVLEPGGAATLAAMLDGKIDRARRTIAVLASGANVDAALFRRALA